VLAWETGDVELLKFGETLNGNPEPIPVMYFSREGVETRRAAPKLRIFPEEGEGIVQTANLARALKELRVRAAKAVDGMKIRRA
jgi:hypothetical protein